MIASYPREPTEDDLVNVGTPGHIDYGTSAITGGDQRKRNLIWVLRKQEEIPEVECKKVLQPYHGPEKKRKGKVRKW